MRSNPARQLANLATNLTSTTARVAAQTTATRVPTTSPTSPTSSVPPQLAGISGTGAGLRRMSSSAPRPMSSLPGSPRQPYAAMANRYGKFGRLNAMPDRPAQPTSENVKWAASSETQKSAEAVRNVVVIGYAEGNELLAAKTHYPNAAVKGIETDSEAVTHAKSEKSGLGSNKDIEVTAAMDFSSAVQNGHVKPGEADRIVMAYVAPYMNDNELANTFAHAAHVQKDGDRFSLSTYGSQHAYTESKGLNIRSASDLLDMAKENGYVLDRAQVRVARENPPENDAQIVTSRESLINLDKTMGKPGQADAWHTMELTFKKDDSVRDE
ncbi:hypothetical protein [Paraburkholderia megapolitana]|uniref:hypothetical protein n=1 Tax=Paraburkholderia megapolitana TaxID=420953 RepID=UPI0038BD09E7